MAAAAARTLAALDAETLALLGAGPDMAPVAVCGEWETFKENVRPLKRGRNVGLLNQALKAHTDPAQRAALLAERGRMIQAIEEYQGEDPLQPWVDCIKWVQESFPAGGEFSGLVVIYEQCVRAFWHDERYKDDLRYLKVWLEYFGLQAGNCSDAEVIFRFLESNQIGEGHAVFYIRYALLMESKNKLKKADEIFNLGIARKAKPVEKLETTYRAFLRRSTRKKEHEDDTASDDQPVRKFGSDLNRGETRGQHAENSHLLAKPRVKLQRIDVNTPISIYKENPLPSQGLERARSKDRAWNTLGTQADRNKENNMMPARWTSHKIPPKVAARPAVPPARVSSIEVFIDEECAEETELLKENPLRNFPLSSLR
ncbi:hypothetical protein TRIUR3_06420 [Triticum urartu]|uniref:Uncharacterized protein n=1 Tax=Triticum urartu TaxID=4572 RepID=M7YMR3_TRIUA|nr:hypothetical protein TRIUR3_06420 [Triticum urartu]